MFELSKWYGDCISDAGDVRIAYSAQVRYGSLKVNYSSLMDGETATHSVRRARIVEEAGGVTWAGPKVHATWARMDEPLAATVFQSGEGAVEWRCIVPKGSAAINEIRGLGYVEHLRMTIAPWKAPIRTLRWGRFVTARTTLIWIDWLGTFETRIVFLNGARVSAVALDDAGLVLDNGTGISLDRAHVMRSGALGSTIFGAVPGLARIAPARMFRVDECKWKSRGRMQYRDGTTDSGWCIHEVVNWP